LHDGLGQRKAIAENGAGGQSTQLEKRAMRGRQKREREREKERERKRKREKEIGIHLTQGSSEALFSLPAQWGQLQASSPDGQCAWQSKKR
jgi:hypothetical protein